VDSVPEAARQLPSVAVERLVAASAQIEGMLPELTPPSRRVALELNSYATPIKGDRTVWTGPEEVSQDYSIPFAVGKSTMGPLASKLMRSLASSMQSASKIEVIGRDDMTFREGLAESRAASIADALTAIGIPRSRIVVKTSAEVLPGTSKGVVVGASITARTSSLPKQSEVVAAQRPSVSGHFDTIIAQLRSGQLSPSQAAEALEGSRTSHQVHQASSASGVVRVSGPWTVRKMDGSVENMLKRWGQGAGWRVVSRGAPHIEIHGDAEVDRRDFLQAADYAITQAKQAGYRIKATAYSNNVLVLTGE
jgi:outer membrane protein OmpA-like peptidoglycan-associated protein